MGEFFNYTLPAFPSGINNIDAIDQIPETDAVDLLNVYPNGTRLELRKGISESWVADTTAVKTLANLVTASGTEYLVAASDNNLYIQNGASSTSIKGASAITLDEWQHVTFNNRLYLCNGTDNAQVYTGTGNAADISFTGGSTPAINTLVFVTSYKERLYFIKKNTGSVWYGNTKAVGTTELKEFDVSHFLKKGGYLVSCGSWSTNIGTTTSDLFYFISSEGELLFYTGSYPGSSDWIIVARYIIGKPLGYRAHVHVENDLWFITNQGIVPVSTLFSTSATSALNSISRKINSIIRDAARSFSFSYMYSAIFYQLERKVIINLPVTTTNTIQLVCNIETGAWTLYQYGVAGAALSLELNEGLPYSGANSGSVYQIETGYEDDGQSIAFKIRGGFNFFGKRGLYKVFKDIRPIMQTGAADLTIEVDIDTDFRQFESYATIATPATDDDSVATWDSDAWDATPWSAENTYVFARYSLRGQGHCGALRIRGSTNALLEFNAFEIRFEEGSQT
jgi:hypothetical protein